MLSMTGYGRSRAEVDGREMTVDLKTVNHRFLDINLRLPRGLLFLEDPIRKGLSARLNRGHVDVFITYRNTRDDQRRVSVDLALLDAYANAYDQIVAQLDIADDRSLTRLAALPDVLTIAEADDDQAAVTTLCQDALSGALDALTAMRAKEGEALDADLSANLDRLSQLAAAITLRAPDVVTEYQAKLTARVTELLDAPPDPQRLAQEVALMADRASIDEELVRLQSHITQIRQTMRSGEPAGRKLDFLVQELNREVNTIGSKASDLQIATHVVESKATIEKIREQVQNIE